MNNFDAMAHENIGWGTGAGVACATGSISSPCAKVIFLRQGIRLQSPHMHALIGEVMALIRISCVDEFD